MVSCWVKAVLLVSFLSLQSLGDRNTEIISRKHRFKRQSFKRTLPALPEASGVYFSGRTRSERAQIGYSINEIEHPPPSQDGYGDETYPTGQLTGDLFTPVAVAVTSSYVAEALSTPSPSAFRGDTFSTEDTRDPPANTNLKNFFGGSNIDNTYNVAQLANSWSSASSESSNDNNYPSFPSIDEAPPPNAPVVDNQYSGSSEQSSLPAPASTYNSNEVLPPVLYGQQPTNTNNQYDYDNQNINNVPFESFGAPPNIDPLAGQAWATNSQSENTAQPSSSYGGLNTQFSGKQTPTNSYQPPQNYGSNSQFPIQQPQANSVQTSQTYGGPNSQIPVQQPQTDSVYGRAGAGGVDPGLQHLFNGQNNQLPQPSSNSYESGKIWGQQQQPTDSWQWPANNGNLQSNVPNANIYLEPAANNAYPAPPQPTYQQTSGPSLIGSDFYINPEPEPQHGTPSFGSSNSNNYAPAPAQSGFGSGTVAGSYPTSLGFPTTGDDALPFGTGSINGQPDFGPVPLNAAVAETTELFLSEQPSVPVRPPSTSPRDTRTAPSFTGFQPSLQPPPVFQQQQDNYGGPNFPQQLTHYQPVQARPPPPQSQNNGYGAPVAQANGHGSQHHAPDASAQHYAPFPNPNCVDIHVKCAYFVANGKCQKPEFAALVRQLCPKSCGACELWDYFGKSSSHQPHVAGGVDQSQYNSGHQPQATHLQSGPTFGTDDLIFGPPVQGSGSIGDYGHIVGNAPSPSPGGVNYGGGGSFSAPLGGASFIGNIPHSHASVDNSYGRQQGGYGSRRRRHLPRSQNTGQSVGEWSQWSAWGDCFRGRQGRARQCSYGAQIGAACLGPAHDMRNCA